jgi:hypothetical protein
MPNHLRPSKSYKGLTRNRLESPTTFKDRIYLTDIVDSFWQVFSEHYPDVSIGILWRKRYFPWRIQIERRGDGHLLMAGKLYGESTWTSAVELQFNDLNGGSGTDLDTLLERFVELLGRPPYESPYWDDDVWQKFTEETGIKRSKIEGEWAKYLGILEDE